MGRNIKGVGLESIVDVVETGVSTEDSEVYLAIDRERGSKQTRVDQEWGGVWNQMGWNP